MKYYIIYPMFALAMSLSAQEVENDRTKLLAEIEKNNTTLAVLRQKVIANKEKNRMDNALPDPSFDFSNTWGNQPNDGTTQNYSVEQELDWGTLSGQRRKTTQQANRQVDLNYLIQRQEILAEADLLIVELTYRNALCEEYEMREERATNLRKLYEKKFTAGDADQLELNKVRLNHTAAVADMRKAKADRDAILEDIQRINGNLPFQYEYTVYSETKFPPLSELISRAELHAPQMAILNNTIDLEERRLKLSKSEAIPNLNVGYAGSTTKGINTNSLTLGINLPIWGNNRRKVKQQRAEITVARMEKEDIVLQIKSSLTREYTNARSLAEIAKQFRSELTSCEDIKILDKALSSGKLSLIDYLNELTFYYNAHTQAIEADRDSQIAISNLWKLFR